MKHRKISTALLGTVAVMTVVAILGAKATSEHAGCAHDKEHKGCSHDKKAAVWKPLFNGKDLSGWERRADHDRDFSWKVVDDLLTNDIPEGHHGTDIVTTEHFHDFELCFEYRVPKGSNSGMYLRGLHELQIREEGDAKPHPGGNGGIWATAAPRVNASRPAGEWQTVYLRLRGQTVEVVILNGVPIHENVELTKPTGGDLRKTIKMGEPGPIMIQGDHGEIQLRHVWIRPLD